MIFQDPFASLNSIHTVYHHLSRPILIHRSYNKYSKKERDQIVEKEIISILEEVDLSPPEDFLYKFPHEMSGGERQRGSVARSLINNPKIVFADEPSGNLDSENAEILHQLFFTLRDRIGCSFVIVTHNELLTKKSDRKSVV